jgi:hypothetical protein
MTHYLSFEPVICRSAWEPPHPYVAMCRNGWGTARSKVAIN